MKKWVLPQASDPFWIVLHWAFLLARCYSPCIEICLAPLFGPLQKDCCAQGNGTFELSNGHQQSARKSHQKVHQSLPRFQASEALSTLGGLDKETSEAGA